MVRNATPKPSGTERITTAETWRIRITLEDLMLSANTSFNCFSLGIEKESVFRKIPVSLMSLAWQQIAEQPGSEI